MNQATAHSARPEVGLRGTFWEQIRGVPDGDKIANCIQCGTCSGTCPVSYAMDITPRRMIALFRAGMMEEILASKTIWLCASCYSCTVRCPSGIKVTDTIYALKRVAMTKKLYPPDFPVYALSRAFSKNIYKYGRNYELGLGIRYLLRAKPTALMGNAGFGLAMVRRGRLGVLPKAIKRVNEVRAIIDRANQLGE